MMSLEEAWTELATWSLPPLEREQVPLLEAVDRPVLSPLLAQVASPPFDACAMDGFALGQPESEGLGPFRVVGRVAAGHSATQTLGPGEACRVFTGAPAPEGSWSVVPQEEAEPKGDWLHLIKPPRAGAHLRRKGSECAQGQVLLAAGEPVKPWAIGLLASQGWATLEVARRPKVGVLSTGDELVASGQPLGPGQIHDANRPQLLALLRAWGFEAIDLGWVPDRLEETRSALRAGAQQCQLLLSSGGASVGEEDHVRAAVQAEGQLAFWKLAIKPGKPLAMGRVGEVPLVALPGNPVAAALTLRMVVRVLLERLRGGRFPASHWAPLAEAVRNPGPRRHLMRGAWAPGGTVRPFRNQGSADLVGLAQAELILEIPEGVELEAGEPVRVHGLWNERWREEPR